MTDPSPEERLFTALAEAFDVKRVTILGWGSLTVGLVSGPDQRRVMRIRGNKTNLVATYEGGSYDSFCNCPFVVHEAAPEETPAEGDLHG